MMLLYVPVLTGISVPVFGVGCIVCIALLFLALIPSSSQSGSSPEIIYRSTDEMVQKFKNKDTIRMLAKELRDRDCLGKIGFNACGYVLTACNARKKQSDYRYSFRELGDVTFMPGEQEAILRALIVYLPDEYDYKLYYEQSVSSDHPHFFYMKSKGYRKAESEGSL